MRWEALVALVRRKLARIGKEATESHLNRTSFQINCRTSWPSRSRLKDRGNTWGEFGYSFGAQTSGVVAGYRSRNEPSRRNLFRRFPSALESNPLQEQTSWIALERRTLSELKNRKRNYIARYHWLHCRGSIDSFVDCCVTLGLTNYCLKHSCVAFLSAR